VTPFAERPIDQRRAITHAYETVVGHRFLWSGGKTRYEQGRWQRYYLIGLRLEAHINGDPVRWESALFSYANRHNSLAAICETHGIQEVTP
jgi:hypothetical protein